MSMERMPRILLVCRQMIPPVYLCGHVQMEWLAREGKVAYRARTEGTLRREDMDWADAALLGRLDSWFAVKAAQALKRAGKQLSYILDDELLAVAPGVSSASHYQSASVKRQIRSLLAMSDAIISPSPLLLQKYATDGKKGVLIEEPAVDPVPYAPHDPGDPVRIGFAGSIDRTGDLAAILGEVLVELKARYGGRIHFEFFGAIPAFAENLGATVIPYRDDYSAYRELLNGRKWDIGLAPMPDTPFHACKHYNKFVEYAAAGIVGVFSDVPPYDRLHGRTEAAVFCENSAQAWLAALGRLIDDRKAREALRRKVCEAARIWSVESAALGLYEQLLPLDTQPAQTVKFAPGLYRGMNVPMRLRELTDVHGWRTPAVLAGKVAGKLHK